MVNKAAFGVGVIVLLAAVGIGVLIGMQIGGVSGTGLGPGEATPTPSEGTPIPAEPEPTATPAPTPTPTAQYTTIPPRTFNAGNVSEYILEYVNEERNATGLDNLSTSGATSRTLQRMAERHSEAMADEGRVIHTIDGRSSADRYRSNNLFEQCELRSDGGGYVESPNNNRFETIGKTVAGQPFTDDGAQQFYGNDSQVARALVQNWNESSIYRDRLMFENANRVGIGVYITSTGNVYATVNVCS